MPAAPTAASAALGDTLPAGVRGEPGLGNTKLAAGRRPGSCTGSGGRSLPTLTLPTLVVIAVAATVSVFALLNAASVDDGTAYDDDDDDDRASAGGGVGNTTPTPPPLSLLAGGPGGTSNEAAACDGDD